MRIQGALAIFLYLSSTVNGTLTNDLQMSLQDENEIDESLERAIVMRRYELYRLLQEEIKAQKAEHEELEREVNEVKQQRRLRGSVRGSQL
jgi:predicted RNase H-like nuclease (RuvC/YqgF family)